MTYIQFQNIHLKFNNKVIFQDFSLAINKGDKLLLSGKSGRGKSTLLNLLLGFTNMDSGKIIIKDEAATPKNYFKIRQMFAFVNQDITLRPGNVQAVLDEIASFSGNEFDGHLRSDLLDYFEFGEELIKKDTKDLSGGERQRLGIILAILLDREVFLLDEITSALDKTLKEKTVDYFSKSDKTVIVVSHDITWSENPVFKEVTL